MENEICRVVATEAKKGFFRLGPDGDKTIVYSWHVPPKGRVKGLGGSQGGFPYVNGLDEEAVDWFLVNYYQPYYDRYRPSFEDGTILGFFFDEPETMGVWGPTLEKELVARGENVGELLTAFKFRLADPEAQKRAIYRYHDARAEVWGRTMYGRQSEWCRKHGVFSSGHFMEHAGCFYSLAMSGGNVMQLMKYVEVPGVDLVCRQYYPNQREERKRQIDFGQMPKIGSSTAHVYNRHNGKNWCEIFGAYGQDLTYPQMKWLCDWHQYQGCYYMIPHSFNPKAPFDRDCPPYFYNGGKEPRYPLFRVWADYNNRCALMLSEGEHVCAIAQCVPGMSFHVGQDDPSRDVRVRDSGRAARQRLDALRRGGERQDRQESAHVASRAPHDERQGVVRHPHAPCDGVRAVCGSREGACVREGRRRGGGLRHQAVQHASMRSSRSRPRSSSRASRMARRFAPRLRRTIRARSVRSPCVRLTSPDFPPPMGACSP